MSEITRRFGLRSGRWAVLVVSASLVVTGALIPMGRAWGGQDTNPGGELKARWKSDPTAADAVPVTFSFHREEQGGGRISLKLGPEGPRYAGSYLRLTGTRPEARIRFFYNYWVSDRFDDHQYGPAGAPMNRKQITIEQFRRRYTGSVIATLVGAEGGGMRCVFDLLDPEGGLARGATGRCQLTNGGVVELAPAARR